MRRKKLTIEAELEILQRGSFSYFVHEKNPANRLVIEETAPDWPASIAATGFALAAYRWGSSANSYRAPPRWSVRLRRCVFSGTVRTALNLMPPDICCSHDDGVPTASCKEWDYYLKETAVTNTNLPSCNAHYMLDCQDRT